MNNIRVQYHQFKNAKEVKNFIDKYSNGVYQDKFNMDILIRYIAANKKFKASQEDMKTLGNIIEIVLNIHDKHTNLE